MNTIDGRLNSQVFRDCYKKVEDSVVCIRKRSFYDVQTFNRREESVMTVQQSVSHGTALVIDREIINGRTEYILLTNWHVGDSERVVDSPDFFRAGRNYTVPLDFRRTALFKHQKLSIVENEDDELADHDTLEIIATDPDHDGALLRTVNISKPLSVHSYMGGTLSLGDRVITSGYPQSQNFYTSKGRVTSVNVPEYTSENHQVKVCMVNIGIDHGQSGSPLFLIQPHYEQFVFPLVGLIYGNSDDHTTRLVMPIENLRQLLDSRSSVESRAPSLDDAIAVDDLQRLAQTPTQSYDIFHHRHSFLKDSRFKLIIQPTENSLPVGHYLEIGFELDNVDIDTIEYHSGDKNVKRLKLIDQSGLVRRELNGAVNDIINHCKRQWQYSQISGRSSPSSLTRERRYFEKIIANERKEIYPSLARMYTILFEHNIIGPSFWL